MVTRSFKFIEFVCAKIGLKDGQITVLEEITKSFKTAAGDVAYKLFGKFDKKREYQIIDEYGVIYTYEMSDEDFMKYGTLVKTEEMTIPELEATRKNRNHNDDESEEG